MGRIPRPLRTPQALPRHLRPFLRHPMHPRTRMPALPAAATRPRPTPTTGRDPRQPARPHRRSPPARLARRGRRAPDQPHRRPPETRPTRPDRDQDHDQHRAWDTQLPANRRTLDTAPRHSRLTVLAETPTTRKDHHLVQRTRARTATTRWGRGCDNTGEALALQLRPGNAGSNTASDHIAVLDEAIAQVPDPHRRDLLITVDGAGATLDLIRHITSLNTVPAGGCTTRSGSTSTTAPAPPSDRCASDGLAARVATATASPATSTRPRRRGVELTGLLRTSHGGDNLANWPPTCGSSAAANARSAGAQLCALEEADGWRYQLFATNTPGRQLALPRSPPPRPRPRRGPHPLRQGHRPGPSPLHLPAINAAWCVAAMIAADLLRWLRLLCLDRPPCRRRTQDAALPAAAHRRPDRPRPTQTQDQNPGDLALGPRAGGRVPRRVRPPALSEPVMLIFT